MSFEFKPIIKKPGDKIESKEWNDIQEGLLEELKKLKEYVQGLTETIILTNLSSAVGQSNDLIVPESSNLSFGERVIGMINKQWYSKNHESGPICTFDILENFDFLDFWASIAKNSDGNEPYGEKALNITLVDERGTSKEIKDLFIGYSVGTVPSPRMSENPHSDVLSNFSNDRYWYRYQVENPNKDVRIKSVKFSTTKEKCPIRVGNVLYLKKHLRGTQKI